MKARVALSAFALLLVVSTAYAHTVCNSVTHYDNNGKICTNFTTPAGESMISPAGSNYWPMTEDGVVGGPDFPGSIGFVPGPNTAYVSLPYDPLKILNLVFSDNGVYVSSVLESANFPADAVPVQTYGRPNGCGGWTYIKDVWPLHDIVSAAAGSYPYRWDGRYTQVFTGQKHIGRFGRCVTVYVTTAPSVGEMSATPQ